MASITSQIIAAASVTFLDVLVVRCCGSLVWEVWGSLFWSRIGLLALASGMAFTLMDIWSQTFTKGTSCSLDATAVQFPVALEVESVDMEGPDV